VLNDREVQSNDGPLAKVLVTTGNKAGIVEGVELDGEDWCEAGIPECDRPALLPLEHLDREAAVHADRDDLMPIGRES
jgi:hypothetical protein